MGQEKVVKHVDVFIESQSTNDVIPIMSLTNHMIQIANIY